MSQPRLLILSFTNAARDPRVYRQAKHLKQYFSVTVASCGDPNIDGVKFHPIVYHKAKTIWTKINRAGALAFGQYSAFLRRFAPADIASLRRNCFDAVLVNDAKPLPLGFEIAGNRPVIFDAHEYYPEQSRTLFNRIFFQRALTRLLQDYIPATSGMTTVCPGIAELYERNFGKKPQIVLNAPEFEHLVPTPCRHDGIIRMIHHGVAGRERRLENMIETIKLLPKRFTLDLMLINPHSTYYKKISQLSKDTGRTNIVPPVKMQDICKNINKYDIGFYILPQTNTNNMYALPNKFFEFIQARLAIAIGPSIEMSSIVKESKLGIISEDFSPKKMFTALKNITAEEIQEFKRNSDRYSKVFNAENCMNTMRSIIYNVI